MTDRSPRSEVGILPAVEYLDLGGEVAVPGTRNQARAHIAALAGVDYVQVNVRREWRKRCDCDACLNGHSDDFHGYDEWWVLCEKTDPAALGWWAG